MGCDEGIVHSNTRSDSAKGGGSVPIERLERGKKQQAVPSLSHEEEPTKNRYLRFGTYRSITIAVFLLMRGRVRECVCLCVCACVCAFVAGRLYIPVLQNTISHHTRRTKSRGRGRGGGAKVLVGRDLAAMSLSKRCRENVSL